MTTHMYAKCLDIRQANSTSQMNLQTHLKLKVSAKPVHYSQTNPNSFVIRYIRINVL